MDNPLKIEAFVARKPLLSLSLGDFLLRRLIGKEGRSGRYYHEIPILRCDGLDDVLLWTLAPLEDVNRVSAPRGKAQGDSPPPSDVCLVITPS